MRILHAIHDFLPRHRAGSEIYTYELARELASRGHQLHLLCAEYDPTREHGSVAWRWYDELPVTEIVNNWRFDSLAESYRPRRIGRQLDHLLAALSPDVLHIHNLLNLSFELPSLAAARGIPSVATLHDYTLLCPSGGQRVHLAEEHVCVEIDVDRCARCFRQSPFFSQMAVSPLSGRASRLTPAWSAAQLVRRVFPRLARAGAAAAGAATAGVDSDEVAQRLEAAREVYDAVDLFVAPSPFLAAEFRRFGMPAEKIRVSDYGFSPLDPAPSPRRQRDHRVRIGFVGTLAWHKGAHVLVDALRSLPADRWELTIHGALDTFPEYTQQLRQASADLPIELAGSFDRERVGEIYAGMDVLVICSLWPENSPLVIHEAFIAGLPVLGARMGGIQDLVEDGVSGLLYDAFSPDSLAAALTRLLDEPELLPRLAAASPAVKSIADDATEWEATYSDLVARRHGSH